MVFTPGKVAERQRATLKKTGAGDGMVRNTAVEFRNGFFARGVEPWNEATAKCCNFGEGVRLTALIGYHDRSAFLDAQVVRLEIPIRIGISRRSFGKQIRQLGESAQRDILAEIGAN